MSDSEPIRLAEIKRGYEEHRLSAHEARTCIYGLLGLIEPLERHERFAISRFITIEAEQPLGYLGCDQSSASQSDETGSVNS